MEKEELIQEIIELQRMVDRDRRRHELNTWMRLRLTIAQLKSLFFISNHGSTSLGKLAAALHVTPTNTTGVVNRMLKRGLITRKTSPDDRRVLLLRTTSKGDQLVANLREGRRERMSEIFNRLSYDEAVALHQALKSLVKIINAYESEPINKPD